MAYEAKTNWQLDDTVTEQDMNRIEQGLKDAYENSMTSPPPEQVNLRYGLQVVDAKRTAPLENVCIKGRTLVNLLGRIGGFENLNSHADGWNQYQVTAVTQGGYPSTTGNGRCAVKINAGQTAGNINKYGLTFAVGRFYIVLADIKNYSSSGGMRIAVANTASVFSPYVTDTNKFHTVYAKAAPVATNSNVGIELQIVGAAGEEAFVDSVRLYEVSEAEYKAIDNMTPEQISVKWPYVDDMKSIYSPYVIKYGENLLPPFTEWEMIRTDNGTSILSPYKIKQQTNAIDTWLGTSKIPCTPSTEYTLSMMHTGKILLRFYKQDGTFVDAGGGYTTEKSVSGMSPADADYIVVYITNPQPVGTFTFENGMLNVGSTVLPFKPRNDDYLFFPDAQLASNIDGSVYDKLFQRDGKYWKHSWYRTVDLDGKLNWNFTYMNQGSKAVTFDSSSALWINNMNGNQHDHQIIKYDGKPLLNTNNDDVSAPDKWSNRSWGTPRQIILSISNADSGWGDSYTPSEEEIKAYFYGWRMFEWGKANNIPYNRTDNLNKAWVQIGQENPGSPIDTSQILPTNKARNYGFTSYKIKYRLTAPIMEEVSIEGGITFNKGLNQVEVGSGMIVREKANPAISPSGNVYNINSLNNTASLTKNQVLKFFAVYCNESEDKKWFYEGAGASKPNGNYSATIKKEYFDLAKVYTVTYIGLDKHVLTCNPLSIQGEYGGNLKNIVDALATNQADMLTRISVLENIKTQKVQGQWITPTLLNGWVNANYGSDESAKYMKDSLGFVHIVGLVKSGLVGQAIFKLPVGYRPKGTLTFAAISNDGNSEVYCRIVVHPTGDVIPLSGSSFIWYTISLPPFLAEQ